MPAVDNSSPHSIHLDSTAALCSNSARSGRAPMCTIREQVGIDRCNSLCFNRNMATPLFVPEFVVWEWTDSDGKPKYVGCGKIVGGVHPAVRMWEDRTNLRSQLGDWLQSLKKEPHRAWKVKDLALVKSDAKKLAHSRRLEHRKKKRRLLSSRPYGTVRGGGAALVVIDEKGDIHESVRDAALAHGISGATVSRRCKNPLSGWCFSHS